MSSYSESHSLCMEERRNCVCFKSSPKTCPVNCKAIVTPEFKATKMHTGQFCPHCGWSNYWYTSIDLKKWLRSNKDHYLKKCTKRLPGTCLVSSKSSGWNSGKKSACSCKPRSRTRVNSRTKCWSQWESTPSKKPLTILCTRAALSLNCCSITNKSTLSIRSRRSWTCWLSSFAYARSWVRAAPTTKTSLLKSRRTPNTAQFSTLSCTTFASNSAVKTSAKNLWPTWMRLWSSSVRLNAESYSRKSLMSTRTRFTRGSASTSNLRYSWTWNWITREKSFRHHLSITRDSSNNSREKWSLMMTILMMAWSTTLTN